MHQKRKLKSLRSSKIHFKFLPFLTSDINIASDYIIKQTITTEIYLVSFKLNVYILKKLPIKTVTLFHTVQILLHHAPIYSYLHISNFINKMAFALHTLLKFVYFRQKQTYAFYIHHFVPPQLIFRLHFTAISDYNYNDPRGKSNNKEKY